MSTLKTLLEHPALASHHLEKLPLPERIQGIYFLFLEGELIYIGESVRIQCRCEDHLVEKRFDEVWFFRTDCSDEKRKLLEDQLILELKPPLNGLGSNLPKHMRGLPARFPVTVKSGNARVKIYHTAAKGRFYFVVGFREGGKRYRRNFTTYREAKDEASLIAISLDQTGKSGLVKPEPASPSELQVEAIAQKVEAMVTARLISEREIGSMARALAV